MNSAKTIMLMKTDHSEFIQEHLHVATVRSRICIFHQQVWELNIPYASLLFHLKFKLYFCKSCND